MENTESTSRKNQYIGSEARKMVASVYHFLKEEYDFTELHKELNSDIAHLRNITRRTSEATGVSPRTVQKILQEERQGALKHPGEVWKKSKPNKGKKTKEKKVKTERTKKKKSKDDEGADDDEPKT